MKNFFLNFPWLSMTVGTLPATVVTKRYLCQWWQKGRIRQNATGSPYIPHCCQKCLAYSVPRYPNRHFLVLLDSGKAQKLSFTTTHAIFIHSLRAHGLLWTSSIKETTKLVVAEGTMLRTILCLPMWTFQVAKDMLNSGNWRPCCLTWIATISVSLGTTIIGKCETYATIIKRNKEM